LNIIYHSEAFWQSSPQAAGETMSIGMVFSYKGMGGTWVFVGQW
jgi:hypothetical protein